MANETEFSNFGGTVAAFVAANMAPAFVAQAVTLPHISAEGFQVDSMSKKFVTAGSLSMAVVGQSAAATKSEYTETSTTLTAQKGVVYVELSIEAQRFTSEDKLRVLAEEAGRAAARKFDLDVLALSAGFSSSVGSTGVDMTPAAFATGIYTLEAADAVGPYASFMHPITVDDLRQDLIASEALQGATGTSLADMQGNNPLKGYLFGIPVYASTQAPSINTNADRSGMIINKYAIAALQDSQPEVWVNKNVQSGLHQLGVYMFYQVGEFVDAGGVQIVADHE